MIDEIVQIIERLNPLWVGVAVTATVISLHLLYNALTQ